MRILIVGATGMLGSTAFKLLSASGGASVYGTVRQHSARRHFAEPLHANLVANVDVENFDSVARVLGDVRPDVVINCVGVVKQLDSAQDPLTAIPINAILPHRLARLCALSGSRLIHISTDCVFSGTRGGYTEADVSDATDLYGRSKYLGEVDYPNAVTLRTSIIGRELGSRNGLLEWFLSQDGRRVRGFTKAIFSGFTTDELVRVMQRVIDMPALRGVYNVSSAPIDKYTLLRLMRDCYAVSIEIEPDDAVRIDRSLDSTRFRRTTGYEAPDWPQMLASMRDLVAA